MVVVEVQAIPIKWTAQHNSLIGRNWICTNVEQVSAMLNDRILYKSKRYSRDDEAESPDQ